MDNVKSKNVSTIEWMKKEITESLKIDNESSDKFIWDKYGISVELFNDLMNRYKIEPEVNSFLDLIKENFQHLLDWEEFTFNFDHPSEITAEVYLELHETSYLKF